jgi:ABC-type lipoprotein export system ATPase subunit
VLQTESLSFRYESGGPPIVDGLSHTFLNGTVTAMVGRSGTGKSTLLYLLGLMLSPSSGRIVLDGLEVPTTDRERSLIRSAHIGFVFQDAILDDARTVIDNVTEGAVYAGIPRADVVDRADELLDRFGVGLRRDAKPGQVSGGQAQRVALCRALLKQPRYLLADEPTGNLDRESAGVVWSALRRHADEGGVVIVATHDQELARSSDEVLEL